MLGRRDRAGQGQQDRRGQVGLPEDMHLRLDRGERTLAVAQDDLTGSWVALTTYRIVVLSHTGDVQVDRPWHDVDTGAWDPDSYTLSLSWVGGSRGLQWQVRTRTGPGRLPEVFWERVQASVVLMREVDLGQRRSARVSIRKVLSTRELVDQVLPGRGARGEDRELAAAVEATRRDLRDQVGLPPA